MILTFRAMNLFDFLIITKKSTSHDALRIVLVDFFCKEIPYGYIRNQEKNTFDVDEETAPVVVRIFEQQYFTSDCIHYIDVQNIVRYNKSTEYCTK